MYYQINKERVLFTQLGDEGVVYDMKTNEYATLNETFSKILMAIELGKGQEEIVKDLSEEYDISGAKCDQEVAAALATLIEKGFIFSTK